MSPAAAPILADHRRRAGAAQPHVPVRAGVALEARDEREFVEVNAEFTVVCGGNIYSGTRLSRRHVVVKAPSGPDASATLGLALAGGEPVGILIRIVLSGFILEVEAQATRRFVLTKAGGVFRFALQDMDARNEAALGQVVRTLLRGVYPTVEEFALPVDGETPLPAPKPASAGSRARTIALCIGTGIAALALIAYAGLSAYTAFMTERSTIAALTAPRIDLWASAAGVVTASRSFSGAVVSRDQHLMSIVASDLAADIQKSRARIDYFNAMLGDKGVTDNGLRDTIAPMSFDDLDLPPPAKPSLLTYARDLELGVLQSLETRRAALDVFAPCDCEVIWSADPKSTVKVGDLVATLAKTDAASLRVEAMFDVSVASSIHAGQRASIYDPATGEKSSATVESVSFDEGDAPRIGVPAALLKNAGYATVSLQTANSTSNLRLGAPLEVVILK